MTQDNRTLTLRALDIPTIHKFGIGFDSVFDEMMKMSSAQRSLNYPPHNVLKIDDNNFVVQFAVAGFSEGELDIQVEGNVLTVAGSTTKDNEYDAEYLVHGISMRDFQRSFTLADNVEVKTANVSNGILSIELERIIPLENLPKKIDINFNK